jgi:hypothetical protein
MLQLLRCNLPSLIDQTKCGVKIVITQVASDFIIATVSFNYFNDTLLLLGIRMQFNKFNF